MARTLKVTVLGDTGVGKSSITTQYCSSTYPLESIDPTIESSYQKTVSVDYESIKLDILDTSNEFELSRTMSIHLKHSDGFILVYSLTSLESLASLDSIYEAIQSAKNDSSVPIIVFGNKKDMESDRKVSEQDVHSLIKNWKGKVKCFEGSAKTAENVCEAFTELTRMMNDDRTFVACKIGRMDCGQVNRGTCNIG